MTHTDLSDCPYYMSGYSGGPGKCSYGCREEPACITEEPIGGWSSVRKEKSSMPPSVR